VGSPCIDAGDPTFPNDPDGTIADMGALYFHHVAEVTITPKNPPILIPPRGGNFRFEAILTNISDAAVRVDAWTVANVPGYGYYGPIIEKRVRLQAGQTLRVPNVPQTVPGQAPAGTYYYIAYVGNYPDKMDSCSFAFFKSGKSVGGKWSVGDWLEDVPEASLPNTAALLGNYPNPFNSSTTITYQLSSSGEASLEVYNLMGEKVATLLAGRQEAGTGTVTWDASQVSSGVYFCKLTLGDYTETRRMLFTK
jgi:hypothetical protein